MSESSKKSTSTPTTTATTARDTAVAVKDATKTNCLGTGVHMPELHNKLYLLPQTSQLIGLHTIIRDKSVSREDFIFYSERLIRLLVEEGLNHLPYHEKTVITPTNTEYSGLGFGSHLCAVSIVRAGESMENAVRAVCKSVRVGKVLIQRNEKTAEAQLMYVKLPNDIQARTCLLLDPMLATGGSALRAIKVLKDHGVAEKNIIFLNLIAAAEGLERLQKECPDVTVITTAIDSELDERKYILPGIGDFGDRFFGTT